MEVADTVDQLCPPSRDRARCSICKEFRPCRRPAPLRRACPLRSRSDRSVAPAGLIREAAQSLESSRRWRSAIRRCRSALPATAVWMCSTSDRKWCLSQKCTPPPARRRTREKEGRRRSGPNDLAGSSSERLRFVRPQDSPHALEPPPIPRRRPQSRPVVDRRCGREPSCRLLCNPPCHQSQSRPDACVPTECSVVPARGGHHLVRRRSRRLNRAISALATATTRRLRSTSCRTPPAVNALRITVRRISAALCSARSQARS